MVMMLNSRKYHALTSYQRGKITPHYLDWENQPSTFKTYPDIELIDLPKEIQFENTKLSHVLSSSFAIDEASSIDIFELSKVMALTYTITGKSPMTSPITNGEGGRYG